MFYEIVKMYKLSFILDKHKMKQTLTHVINFDNYPNRYI